MSTAAEAEDVVLDIDNLKTFTIPKRKKSKTGTVVGLDYRGCLKISCVSYYTGNVRREYPEVNFFVGGNGSECPLGACPVEANVKCLGSGKIFWGWG